MKKTFYFGCVGSSLRQVGRQDFRCGLSSCAWAELLGNIWDLS